MSLVASLHDTSTTETNAEEADLNTKAQVGYAQYPHQVSAIVDFAACSHLPKRAKLGPSAKLLHFRNLHRDYVGLGWEMGKVGVHFKCCYFSTDIILLFQN